MKIAFLVLVFDVQIISYAHALHLTFRVVNVPELTTVAYGRVPSEGTNAKMTRLPSYIGESSENTALLNVIWQHDKQLPNKLIGQRYKLFKVF